MGETERGVCPEGGRNLGEGRGEGAGEGRGVCAGVIPGVGVCAREGIGVTEGEMRGGCMKGMLPVRGKVAMEAGGGVWIEATLGVARIAKGLGRDPDWFRGIDPDTLRRGERDELEGEEWRVMVPMGILEREKSRKRSYVEGQGVFVSALRSGVLRAASISAWSRSTSRIACVIDLRSFLRLSTHKSSFQVCLISIK